VGFYENVHRVPTFTDAEWKQVYEYLREWVKESIVTAAAANGGTLHRSH
jgi:hypothetical protein